MRRKFLTREKYFSHTFPVNFSHVKNFLPTGENFYASKSSFLKGLWRRLSPPTLTIKKNYSVAIVVCNNSENIVTSKNLFAKKPKIVREHCFKPPRTTRKTGIKQLLNQGPQMLTSTKCTFVPHNMYFCALRVLVLFLTGPTPVPYGSDTRSPRVRHPCLTIDTLLFCVNYVRVFHAAFRALSGALKNTYGWKKIYSRYKFIYIRFPVNL